MNAITLEGSSLVSVRNEYGRMIPTYDDYFGTLWVFRNASGLAVVVRTSDWSSAYEIVDDEIKTPIDEDDIPEAYGFNDGLPEGGIQDDTNLIEGYIYQSNATGSGIVEYDLNGEYLEPLTPELLSRLGWTIVTTDDNWS